MKVRTGAFVARRKGLVFITGNSGFPKSMNISKVLDRRAGVASHVVGPNPNLRPAHRQSGRGFDKALGSEPLKEMVITTPGSEGGAKFGGWGTALKPAWEPFLVGVKP